MVCVFNVGAELPKRTAADGAVTGCQYTDLPFEHLPTHWAHWLPRLPTRVPFTASFEYEEHDHLFAYRVSPFSTADEERLLGLVNKQCLP